MSRQKLERRVGLLAVAVVVAGTALAGNSAGAQQLLSYTDKGLGVVAAAQSTDPAAATGARSFEVRVDFDLLRQAPETLEARTPDGGLVHARLAEFKDRGAGDFLWSGHALDDGGEIAGVVLFTMVDGGVIGLFGEPGETEFELHAIEGEAKGLVHEPNWLRAAAGVEGALAEEEDHQCGLYADPSPEFTPSAPPAESSPATAGGQPASVGSGQSALPAITLSTSPAEVSEDAASPVEVTVTATVGGAHRFAADQTIKVTVSGGTAASGSDFADIAGFDLVIPAGDGSATATFDLHLANDSVPETHETIDVSGFLAGVNVAPARIELLSDDIHRIDVLVLFTAYVRARIHPLNNLTMLRDATAQFDYASRVLLDAGAAAEYNVVHVAAAPSDLEAAIRGGKRAIHAVRDSRQTMRLRDDHDADIVYLMGYGAAGIWDGGQAYWRHSRYPTIREYAWAGQNTTNYLRPYRQRSTAHELAHTFGGLHERGEPGQGVLLRTREPLAPYVYGYFDTTSRVITILAYGRGTVRRAVHYSTARRLWNGVPLGRVDHEEVDRLLKRTAPETAYLSDWITPGPPTGLAGTASLDGGTANVALTWNDESSRETAQRIEYRTADMEDWTTGATVQPNVEQATITGLGPGVRYLFRIRALNRLRSYPSAELQVTTPGDGPPTRPSNLTASTPDPAMARLAWADNSLNETGFDTGYREYGAPAWTAGPSVAANVRTVDVTGLADDTEYEFRVGATNGHGTSWSDPVAAHTAPPGPPPTPTAPLEPGELLGRRLTGTSVRLLWIDRSTDETGFAVEVRPDGGGDADWSVARTLPAGTETANVAGLPDGAALEFRIAAIGDGPGAFSYSDVLDLDLSAEPPPAAELVGEIKRVGQTIFADLRWTIDRRYKGDFRIWHKASALTSWEIDEYWRTGKDVRLTVPSYDRVLRTYRVETRGDGGSTFSNEIQIDFNDLPPAAVKKLKAAVGPYPTEVRLTWNQARGATGYRVSYTFKGKTVVHAVYPSDATKSFVDGLASGTYTFTVAALNRTGFSNAERKFKLPKPANAPPKAAELLSVEHLGKASLQLRYKDRSTDETHFAGAIRPDDGVWNYARTDTLDGPGDTRTIRAGWANVAEKTLYHFRVLAESANGSLNSNFITFYSSQDPGGVTAVSTGSSSALVAWTDRATQESRFVVQYRGASGGWTNGATVKKNGTSGSVDGLTPGERYRFRVRARIASSFEGQDYWDTSDVVELTMPPPAPTGVTATAVDSTTATVQWTDGASGETGFVIEARPGGDPNAEWSIHQRTEADATSATVSRLTAGAAQEVRVLVDHPNGLSSPSDPAPLTMPPPPPSGLVAAPASATSVTLTWVDESTDETAFVAEYRAEGAAAWTTFGTEAAANAKTLTVTSLPGGANYEFRVRARSANGLSSPSNIARVAALGAPAATTALTATASGPTTADLAWTDNSNNETGFDIEQRKNGVGDWTRAATAAANATSAAVAGLSPSTTYELRVNARNANGAAAGEPATLAMPPREPQEVAALAQDSTSVLVTWVDRSRDETGFRLEHRTGGGAWTSRNVNPNVEQAAVGGLAPSAQVEFRVTAVSANGESAAGIVSLTMPPAAPTNLAATEASSTSVALTWTDNSPDETGFLVEHRVHRSGAPWSTHGTEAAANATTLTVGGLAAGAAVELRVLAKSAAGPHTPSDPVSVGPLGGPAAPGNVIATAAGSTGATVNWTDNSTDETGFLVEHRLGSDFWTTGAAVDPDETSAVVAHLFGSRTYEFRVTATGTTGANSSAPASLTLPPPAPTELSAAEASDTSVTLSWADNSSDETGFVVEYVAANTVAAARSASGAANGRWDAAGIEAVAAGQTSVTWTAFATVAAADAETIEVTGLASDTPYAFRVSASHATNGMSSPSNLVWLNSLGLPAAPSGVAVTALGPTSASATWTDNSADETGFTVEYRQPPGIWTTGATVGENAVTATVMGLAAGTAYEFRVNAVNGNGASPGPTVLLTTPMPPASCTAVSTAVTATNPADAPAAAALAADCAFLLDNMATLLGTSPDNGLNWAANLSMASWDGVSIPGGRVGTILLPSWGLKGTFPASLAPLDALTQIRITNGELTGGIPTLPASLTDLDLSGNALSGTIPDLSGVTALANIHLSNNGFTGGVPTGARLPSGVLRLEILDNDLSGPIPDLSALSSLFHLDLTGNGLTGGIPALPASLVTLRLIDNDLSRAIGDLSGVTALEDLHLDDNGFDGDIPDASELPGGLEQLWVRRNMLDGSSFPDLSGLASLRDIRLDDNALTGSLPDHDALPPDLRVLLLYNNRYTGPIPALNDLSSLIYLYLQGNALDGAIPAASALPPSLQRLVLSANGLDQAIPDLSALTSLVWFYATGNELSGNVPTAAMLPAGIQVVALGGNELAGGIPDFSTRTSLSHLYLQAQADGLTGSIPTTLPTSLQVLHLGGNDLANAVPSQLGNLTSLTQLSLCDNSLTGTLPSALETRLAAGTLAVFSCAGVADASATEGSAVEFTVTHDTFPLPGAADAPGLTVSYFTSDGSGDAAATSADYAAVSAGTPGAVTIPGNTSAASTTSTATISVATTQDSAVEGDETFTVGLTLPSGVEVIPTRATATGTIEDDDMASNPTVELSVNDSGAVTEGGTLTLTATVSAAPSGTAVTVPVQRVAANSTALAADYSLGGTPAGTITVADGNTTGTLTLTAETDTLDEQDETLRLALGTVSGHDHGSSSHVDITITDDTATTVVLEVTDAAATEGTASATATIQLTLGRALVDGEALGVPLGFSGGTAGTDFTLALSGSPSNVGLASGTVTFTGPGAAAADITLTPANDDDAENRTVTVSIPASSSTGTPRLAVTNLDGGATGSRTGAGQIAIDDDETKSLVFSDTTVGVTEGASATYTVKLGSQPTTDVTVTVSGHGSTDLKVDTNSVTMGDQTTLTFTTSTWNTVRTVTVSAEQDTDTDNEAAVTLAHAATGGGYASVSGDVIVNITDDDDPKIDLSVNNSGSVTEGGTLTITATVGEAPSGTSIDIPVEVDTANTTAGTGDYSLSGTPAGTITVADGNTTGTLTLTATNDSLDEPDETLRIELGTPLPTGYARGATPHVDMTITDNDATTVVLEVTDAAAEEGTASATATIQLTLGRALVAGEVLGVPLGFSGGTAGTDFTLALSGSPTGVTFAAASSTVTFTGPQTGGTATIADITLTPADDADAEDRTVTVSIPASSSGAAPVLAVTNLDGGATGSRTGLGRITITDDETKRLVFSDTTVGVTEGASASYTVKLGSQPTTDVTVTVSGHGSTDLKVDTNSVTMGDQNTLTFTTSTWNSVRTVTVTAEPDANTANESIVLAHAASGGGYGSVSGAVTVNVTDDDDPPSAPAAPTGVTASATGSTSVSVSWTDASANETGFRVEYRTGSNQWASGATAGVDATSATVAGLSASTAYDFRVVAWNSVGSGESTVVSLTMPPASPSGVAVAATGSTSASVTWTDESSDETGFTVERRTGTAAWTSGATASEDAEQAAVTGLSASTAYDFRVLSVNANGSSASTPASLTMPPAAPTGLVAQAASTTSVTLTWTDASSDETSFVAEYRTASAQSWTVFGTAASANAATLVVTGLTAGTSYEFRVFARHGTNGLSSPSNVASVGTTGPPLAPTGVAVTPSGSTSVSVTWTDASTDETSFRVEYRTGTAAFGAGATVLAGVERATLTGLSPSTAYDFRVASVNAHGASASPVASLTMPPSAVSELGGTATDATTVTLVWTVNSSDETSFAVEYRAARTEDWTAFAAEAAAGSTTTAVTGLMAGTSHDFRVYAKHSANGLSSPSGVTRVGAFGAPAPPTAVAAAPAGAGAVRLTWTDASADETGFEIEYREANPGVWRKFETEASADAESIVVTGLAADTLYEFRVLAKNAAGGSSPSPVGAAMAGRDVTPPPLPPLPPLPPPNRAPTFDPSTPLTLTVVEGTTGEIGSPVAASDPDDDVLSYSLSGAGRRSFAVDSATGQLSVKQGVTLDASARSSYEFSVVASDGDLTASREVAVEVVEPRPPGGAPAGRAPDPPTGLQASLLTSEVVVLTWRDNADDETGFELFYREDTGGWELLGSRPANAETATVEELTGGIEYEFVVAATNRYGRTASNVAAIELSLAPPTHLDAVPVSETSARVTWRDNAVAETGYEVQLRPADGDGPDDGGDASGSDGEGGEATGWTAVATVGPDGAAAVLDGLEPGASHLFRVAALGRDATALSGTARFTLADPPADGETTDCTPAGSVATLSGGYDVRMCVELPSGTEVDASNYHLESTASGLLHFFDRDNVEVLVKVLDGCAINGHRWVFIAPVTTLAFNLEIVERSTGSVFTHRNPRRRTAATVGDTAAFACAPATTADAGAGVRAATASEAGRTLDRPRRPAVRAPADGRASRFAGGLDSRRPGSGQLPAPVCEPDGPGIELESGHRIDMCFETPDGEVRAANDWGLPPRSSALLHFFDRENAEVLIKVLDGCKVNGHMWVFAAPATDLAFQLVVTAADGQRWTHENAAGHTAEPRSDTAAFACR